MSAELQKLKIPFETITMTNGNLVGILRHREGLVFAFKRADTGMETILSLSEEAAGCVLELLVDNIHLVNPDKQEVGSWIPVYYDGRVIKNYPTRPRQTVIFETEREPKQEK